MPQFGGDQFLGLLDPDPGQAERKYQTLRSKLVFYFRHNCCKDPENLADEVIHRAIRRLGEGVAAHSGITAYCYGVAEFVLREERRRPHPQELPEELPQDNPSSPLRLNRSEQGILVDEFLRELSPVDRDLFCRYHLGDRDRLAETEQLSPNGLRIRIFRIKKKLLEKRLTSRPKSAGEV